MVASRATLLIPIENQVREPDANLLLACVAARRGQSSVTGPKGIARSLALSFPTFICLSTFLLCGHINCPRGAADLSAAPKPPLVDRLGGWYTTTKRRIRNRSTFQGEGTHPSLDCQQHKHPELTLGQRRSTIDRFQELQEDDRRIEIEPIYPQVFRVCPQWIRHGRGADPRVHGRR
jgi:hypothetical protein